MVSAPSPSKLRQLARGGHGSKASCSVRLLMKDVDCTSRRRTASTCFMRFAIDAVYFDGEGRVVKVVSHLAPWLGLSACLRAKGCLEMKAGEANRLGIQVGMVRA